MIAEIEEYQEEANAIQNKCIDRMLGIMDAYYSNMKLDMGIAEQQKLLLAEQEGQNDDALKLDEVLNKLRPNTTAKNFKEFLQRSDNINKTTHWKRVSRKLNPTLPDGGNSPGKLEKKASSIFTSQILGGGAKPGSESNFKTSVLNAYDPREQRLKIQSLVSSYDFKGAQQSKEDSQSVFGDNSQPRLRTAGRVNSVFSEQNLPP